MRTRREPLGDGVDRDGDRGHQSELPSAAEGDADADAFGDRVHRHDADEQKRLARIGFGERLEVDVPPSSQLTRRPCDEENADQRTAGHTPEAVARALVEEECAGGKHESGRHRARDADPRARQVRDKEEWAGTEAGRERGYKRRSEDGEHARFVHPQCGLLGWAKMTSTLSCS